MLGLSLPCPTTPRGTLVNVPSPLCPHTSTHTTATCSSRIRAHRSRIRLDVADHAHKHVDVLYMSNKQRASPSAICAQIYPYNPFISSPLSGLRNLDDSHAPLRLISNLNLIYGEQAKASVASTASACFPFANLTLQPSLMMNLVFHPCLRRALSRRVLCDFDPSRLTKERGAANVGWEGAYACDVALAQRHATCATVCT